MSETAPSAARQPDIQVYKRNDETLVAHVHVADKLRTIFATDMAQLGRRVISALIGEFQVEPNAAHDIVDAHGLVPAPSPGEMAALRQDYSALGAHADDLAAELKKQREAVSALRAEIEAANGTIADLRDQLTAATIAPAPAPVQVAVEADVRGGRQADAGAGQAVDTEHG